MKKDSADKKKGKKLPIIIVIVAIIVIFAALGSGSDDTEDDASADTTTAESSEDVSTDTSDDTTDDSDDSSNITQYDSGMYKVGEDIPAGEYLLEESDGFSYWEVASDSSGELDSIVANDNYTNREYVTVSDGQYFTFDGTATPVAEASAYTADNGYYPEGTYLVGVDIPAGEYKISLTDDNVSGYGYYEVCSDSTGTIDSIITNDNIENDVYQTVEDGQYLTLSGTEIKGE